MRGRGGELGAQRGAIRRSLRPLLPARRRAPPAEAPPSTAPRFSRGPRRLRFPPSLDIDEELKELKRPEQSPTIHFSQGFQNLTQTQTVNLSNSGNFF